MKNHDIPNRCAAAVATLRTRVHGIALLCLGAVASAGVGMADEPEKAKPDPMIERVTQLVRQLDAESPEERDAAGEQLLEIGPPALPHLPSLDSRELSAEQRRRLRTLLPTLWKVKLFDEVTGSKVRLPDRPILFSAALESLRQQTGNRITDLRGQLNQGAIDGEVLMDGAETTFWQALDRLARQAEVAYYPYTEDRSVGLGGAPMGQQPVAYAGAFRFSIQRIVLQTDYSGPEARSLCRIPMQVAFEPRLRPLLIEVVADRLGATDDRDRELTFDGPESLSMKVDASSNSFEMILRLKAPPRDANEIAVLNGGLTVMLPARTDEFVFPLPNQKRTSKRSAGLNVTLASVEDDDGIWAVPVYIERSEDGSTDDVESHLRSAVEAEAFLRKKDGTRFDQNGGTATLEAQPGKFGIEYLFVDAPGTLDDYELVVRIPVGLTRLPIEFSFRNLALP